METANTRIAAVTKEEWRPFVERAIRVSGFCDEDGQVIRNAAVHIEPRLDEVSDLLYDAMLSCEPIGVLIKADDEGVVFRERMRAWLASLVAGKYGDKFWSWQWVFGLILLKNKLDSAYFAIAYARLSVIMVDVSFELFSEESAKRVAKAYLSALGCISSVVCKSYQNERQAAIIDAGMNEAVLDRVIKLSIDNKIKNFMQ